MKAEARIRWWRIRSKNVAEMGSRWHREELQYEWKCIAAVVRKTAKRLSSYPLDRGKKTRRSVVEWGSTGKLFKGSS